MALRNQPYIPLYVQDFQTDEKLIECSAQSTGVYIRLMCIMHKSDRYGTILLKQNDKQSTQQIKNFATKLVRSLPYTLEIILSALTELLAEKVLYIDGDFLCQKRMIKDNSISEKRAKAGKDGGDKTAKHFAKAKVKAKPQATAENEIEYKNEDEVKVIKSDLELAWDGFLEMRKKIKKPPTDRALELLKLKVVDLSKGDEQKAVEVLNQSTLNNWQDIFEIRTSNNNGKQTRKSGHDNESIRNAARAFLQDNQGGDNTTGG